MNSDNSNPQELGQRMLQVVKAPFPIFRARTVEAQEIEQEKRKLAKIVELVKKGADVNVVDENGETALHWAAYNRQLKIVKYLVANGADVDRKGLAERTPLSWVRTSQAVAMFLSQYTTEDDVTERVKAKLKRELLDKVLHLIGTRGFARPTCFISYAWESDNHKQWVEQFATDLKQAGVHALLDVWDNPVGTRIAEYIGKINTSDFVVLVGSPQLRTKYDSANEKATNPIIAAELSRIDARLMRNSDRPDTIIPVLRAGDPVTAFHPTIHDYSVVYTDLRNDEAYATSLLSVISALHSIPDKGEFMNSIRGDLNRQFAAVDTLSIDDLLSIDKRVNALKTKAYDEAMEVVKGVADHDDADM